MKRLFLIALTASVVGCGPDTSPSENATAAIQTSKPIVKLDDSLFPILNATLDFETAAPSSTVISDTAEALKLMASHDSMKASAKAEAVNVTVRGQGAALWMHMTLPAKQLREAVLQDRPAGYFLLIASDVGFNSIAAERAARSYCAGSSNRFCDQVT